MPATPPKVPVQMGRGDRWVIPILILLALVIPAVAATRAEHPLDSIRWFVIVQAVIALLIYLKSAFETFKKAWSERNLVVGVAQELRLARGARITACSIFIISEGYGVIERLGNDAFDPRTPMLQLALILLMLAYGFMDRRTFQLERKSDSPDVKELIRQLEESYKNK